MSLAIQRRRESPLKVASNLALVFLSCFAFGVICGSLAFVVRESTAEDTSADLNIDVTPVIALALNPETVELAVTPSPSGVLVKEQLSANVTTNNLTGYTLTMNTPSSDTSLTHYNGADTIPSTTNSTPASLATNTWGYNVGVKDSINTFLTIPSASKTISSSTIPASNDTTNVTIGTFVDTTAVSGTYSSEIVFTAVTNYLPPTPVISSISPMTNMTGGDIYITGKNFYGTGSSSAISAVTVGGVNCQSFVVSSDTSAICVLPLNPDGTAVVSVTTNIGTSNQKSITYDSADKGDMQNFTAAMCSSMPTGLARIYTDSRTDIGTGLVHQYRVKKMADGKCWMIDNLKYAWGTNSSNTGVNQNDLSRAYFADPSTSYASDGGTYCMDGAGTLAAAGSTTKCGYLYSHYAATYGTGQNMSSGDAAGSICPNSNAAGTTASSPWRLPSGNVGGDFSVLDVAMGGTGESQNNAAYSRVSWFTSGSFSGVISGHRYSTSSSYQGSSGYYWSSTVSSSTNARLGSFASGSVNPGISTLNKAYGFSVRCVVSP